MKDFKTCLCVKSTYMFPFMQIREVDFSIDIDVLPCFDHHGTSGLDKADGRIEWISVEQPQANGNVVHIS